MTTERDVLELVQRHPLAGGGLVAGVEVGPGDDCAVLVGPGHGRLLVTVDHAVEGRHVAFGCESGAFARMAVARSVSDIAAMGGVARWTLATVLGAAGSDRAATLTDALARWCAHFRAPLVGGDLASWAPGGRERTVVLTTTVIGEPHPVRGPVLRSGAKAGDSLYVTGQLGGAPGSGRHLWFEPRVREAAWLCTEAGAALHAMMDLSDGLGVDGSRLAAASGVRLEIEAGAIPLAPGVLDWQRAAGDGEDYELLFAVGPGITLPGACPDTGVPITRIGRVVAGSGCVAIEHGGTARDISSMGWVHGVQ